MTFEEACYGLRAVAQAFREGVIDRDEWFEQVDRILKALPGYGDALPPELRDAALGRDPATRTSTSPGTQPRGSSRRSAARRAPVASPDAP